MNQYDAIVVGGSFAGWSAAMQLARARRRVLLIDGGNATRVGAGSAYFLRTVGLPEVCKPKTPLTYRNVTTQRLSASGTFDMRNWANYDGSTVNYSISAVNGVLSSTQPGGSIY
eukprot:gene35132-43313_t